MYRSWINLKKAIPLLTKDTYGYFSCKQAQQSPSEKNAELQQSILPTTIINDVSSLKNKLRLMTESCNVCPFKF